MLATGITLTTIAQQESITVKTAKTFEPAPGSIRRIFTIELGKGNKMQVELPRIEDLDHLNGIDSLVRNYLEDIKPLKTHCQMNSVPNVSTTWLIQPVKTKYGYSVFNQRVPAFS